MTSSAASTSFVSVDRRADGVAVLRVDRPDRNSLSTAVLMEIRAHAEELTANPPGAVVVWGGEKIFSQGGDSSEFDHFDREVGRQIADAFHGANSAIAAIPRPTIAAIAGSATGGGLELALACDFRVAASDAQLGQYEIKLGLFPGGGGTQRLTRLIGTSRAKAMIFSGDVINAAAAEQIGLVDRVVPVDEVLQAALQWASSFASGPVRTLGIVKQVIDDGLSLSLADGLRLERKSFIDLIEAWGEAHTV